MNCKNCEKETNNPTFCSRSCAASFNNKGKVRFGKPKPKCLSCGNKIIGNAVKFCSLSCHVDYRWKSKVSIIESNKPSSHDILKKYLVITNNVCCECDTGDTYNGKPITLELDHIDGDSSNNILSNVRLLCPNCHSQTDNYKFKNTNNPKGKEHRRKRYYKKLK